MSHPQNEEWLESAYEGLEHAVLIGDVSGAKEIIADTFDAGFAEQARHMTESLRGIHG